MTTVNDNADGKNCTKCLEWKPLAEFSPKSGKPGKFESRCKPCLAEYKRAHKEANRERHREQERARYAANPAPRREAHDRWKEQFPERMKAAKEKNRQLPKSRIEANVRGAVHKTIKKGMKYAKTFAALGYSSEQLMMHLASKFLPGMTWGNYGPVWHIDHIIPLSLFNYQSTDDFDFKRAWALSNLQPLWAKDNMQKGDRYCGEFQPSLSFGVPANDNIKASKAA